VSSEDSLSNEGSRIGDPWLEARLRCRLREFDLDVLIDSGPAGGRLAILGPSGSGKSTILRAIAGLLKPDEGFVRLNDRVLFDEGQGIDLPPEQRRVAYVPQDPTLFPHLDAAGNVAYSIRKGSRAKKRARAVELLDLFGLGDMASVRPAELSGGEAKRVSLARAIAVDPALFLLDEPLASLDSKTHQKTLDALTAVLQSSGAPVLLATHSPAEAGRLAGRSMQLDRGRFSEDSRTTEEEAKWNRSIGSTTSPRRPVSIHRTMKK
jgi:molybdate transport system ATP-binding protein